jgi:thioredoxin reductase (NADPH)
MGPEMMDIFRSQAKRFGAECLYSTVDKVNFKEYPFLIESNKETYSADSVIISTGASARLLGLDSEKELMGHGVSACATCDGFFFKDKEVIVVGGGDSAMEEATFLTKFASKVTLVHRRSEFRASKIMVERALSNPKIKIMYDSEIEDILGSKDKGVHGVAIKNTRNDERSETSCDGIFMAIGHTPNTKLFNGDIDLDDTGYIITKPDSTFTNIDGVFACGDVQDHTYRQAVTAAGSGCMAAIDAERWLDK